MQPQIARSVLVVEDEFPLRMMMIGALEEIDVSVVDVSSADEAWDYLRRGGKPDLVVSDIQMRGHMDGLALAEAIHSTFPDLPVILTSGNDRYKAELREPDFLPKPIQWDRFLATVGRYIGAGRSDGVVYG